ncbi:hypothetical protein BC833DRAFT_527208 [Globomyces pollinis-pini]|nr:hypothetical protein BC833DRAFT_527208 [Globomyces pollinis-pini]
MSEDALDFNPFYHLQIIHDAPDFIPNRVICLPIDTLENSVNAVQYAINRIINHQSDRVVLLHVMECTHASLLHTFLHTRTTKEPAFKDFQLDHSKTLLTKVAAEFQSLKIHVTAILLQGEVRESLRTQILVLKPDLIVLGKQSKNTLADKLLGTVSNYLLRSIDYPILIVPETFNKH